MPEQLPQDFTKWTLAHARQAITQAIEATVTADGYERNRDFVEKQDFFRDGAEWVGPNGGGGAVWARIKPAIERQFTPYDVVGEALSRIPNALLKREAKIDFAALTPAEDGTAAATKQAEAAAEKVRQLSAWWDRVKLWERARRATTRSRWATRGALRLFLPAGQLERTTREDGAVEFKLPTGLAFEDALTRVQLDAPAPDKALVYTDPDTQKRLGIVIGTDTDDKQIAELWFVEGANGASEGESAVTVVRTVREAGEPQEFRLRARGRLPVAEMEAALLVTEPVRDQQNRLNFIESSLLRLVEAGAFPERYTKNAARAGIWIRDTPPADDPKPEKQVIDNVTWYLHPVARTLGPATMTELRGFEYNTNDTGGKGITTPDVVRFEPTNPAGLIEVARHARRTILQSCKQGHLAAESTAEASGVAYEQARTDFEDDLAATKGALEGLVRDILEAAIAFAEAMGPAASAGGTGSFLARFRCVVTLHVSAGPVSTEQRKTDAQAVKDGQLSVETAMARADVEDVAAELEKIRTSPLYLAALATARAQAVKALNESGLALDPEVVLKAVGYSEEEVKAMVKPLNPMKLEVVA